jgi:hypothetical protein
MTSYVEKHLMRCPKGQILATIICNANTLVSRVIANELVEYFRNTFVAMTVIIDASSTNSKTFMSKN